MMNVAGKVAIVTGSSSGVGRATALDLADRGCSVVINYVRSTTGAEAVASEVRARGVRALVVRADVSSDDDCRSLVDAAVSTFGQLDVLINNAGTTTFCDHRDLEGVDAQDFARIFAVNVTGPFQMARAARPALESSGGAIVNVSSIAGLRGRGSSIPYCASKAALNSLTVTLARALAPRIRVNAVAPGFITGRWLEDGLGERYEALRAASERAAPLGRVCEPADVAAAILSLLTGSDLITGHILPVEGGTLIGA